MLRAMLCGLLLLVCLAANSAAAPTTQPDSAAVQPGPQQLFPVSVRLEGPLGVRPNQWSPYKAIITNSSNFRLASVQLLLPRQPYVDKYAEVIWPKLKFDSRDQNWVWNLSLKPHSSRPFQFHVLVPDGGPGADYFGYQVKVTINNRDQTFVRGEHWTSFGP